MFYARWIGTESAVVFLSAVAGATANTYHRLTSITVQLFCRSLLRVGTGVFLRATASFGEGARFVGGILRVGVDVGLAGGRFEDDTQADELGEEYGAADHPADVVRGGRVERRADVTAPFLAHLVYPVPERLTTESCAVLEGIALGEPVGDVGHGVVTGTDRRQLEREERNSASRCVEPGDDAKRVLRPEVNAEGLGGAVNVVQLELVVGAEGTDVGRGAAVAASRGGVLVPRVVLVEKDHGDRWQNRREQDSEQIAHVERGEHHGGRVHAVELVVLVVHVVGHDVSFWSDLNER